MLKGKTPLHIGMRTGCHYFNSLSIRRSVCLSVSVRVTFVVLTSCESCTRPTSTDPGSREAGEYVLTRGTCFVARRLEVVSIAGLLLISLCVLGEAGFRVFHDSAFFQIRRSSTVSVDSVRGQRQPASPPTEKSRPPIPTKCTISCAHT